MFGYIKPYKPDMKVSEFDTFQAIYCGLCKQLGRVYGPFSSLTLSYDFTFVSAVALGLANECTGFKKCSCTANCMKKKMCHNESEELTFCAGAAMLMMYYKLQDNLQDSGFFGKLAWLPLLPFASFAKNKARKLYPEIDEIIKNAMKEQAAVEKSDNISIDRAAHPTANALALICEYLSPDPTQKQILNRFGYLLGRYVYFSDALDDLEKDKKAKGYNPFLRKYADISSIDEIKKEAVGVINITIAEIAPAYELLALKRYKPILDNVIYLGLHNTIQNIIENKLEETKKRKV